MKRPNGRLLPLSKRLSVEQQIQRMHRIAARAYTAETLGVAVLNITTLLRRGFFGRMKWLLMGR